MSLQRQSSLDELLGPAPARRRRRITAPTSVPRPPDRIQRLKDLPDDLIAHILLLASEQDDETSICNRIDAFCSRNGFEYLCERQDLFDFLNLKLGFYGHLLPNGEKKAGTRFGWETYTRHRREGRVMFMEELLPDFLRDRLPPMRNPGVGLPSTAKELFVYTCYMRRRTTTDFFTPNANDFSRFMDFLYQYFGQQIPSTSAAGATGVFIPGFLDVSINFIRDEHMFVNFQAFSFRRSWKEFALRAVQVNDTTFARVGGAFQNDPDIASAAVFFWYENIGHVSDTLTDNAEFCLKIIRAHPNIPSYFSERLKNDREFAIQAVGKSSHMFASLSEPLRQDAGIVMLAMQNPDAYRIDVYRQISGSTALWEDEHVCRFVLDQNPFNVTNLRPPMDLRMREYAVSLDGEVLMVINDEGRRNVSICTLALIQSIDALHYVDRSLRDNAGFRQFLNFQVSNMTSFSGTPLTPRQRDRILRFLNNEEQDGDYYFETYPDQMMPENAVLY